eukprot:6458286-Amphidinium_carterae.1
MDSHAGANSMKASWATSWERGGGGGGEGGGRSRSPSHHPPEASRKVLAISLALSLIQKEGVEN